MCMGMWFNPYAYTSMFDAPLVIMCVKVASMKSTIVSSLEHIQTYPSLLDITELCLCSVSMCCLIALYPGGYQRQCLQV